MSNFVFSGAAAKGGKSRGGGLLALVLALLIFSLAGLPAVFLAGCAARGTGSNPPANYTVDQVARDVFYAAKGFIEQAQIHHGDECRAVPQCEYPGVKNKGTCTAICGAINKAVDAQNLLGDTISLYCAGPAQVSPQGEPIPSWQEGGPCNPQPAVEPRLREALGNLDQILARLRGLGVGGKP